MKRKNRICRHLAGMIAFILLIVATRPGAVDARREAQGSGPGAAFTLIWTESCETPPAEAVTTLKYAAGLWGTWLSSTVPIEVSACWTPNLGTGDALGTGMPTGYIRNFPGAPLADTAYPIALANALNGSDLDPSGVDITLQFKSDVAWSFVTETLRLAAPADGEDFVAIALHELAHGLGFVGNMYESYSVGFCGDGMYGSLYPCPTPYDWFAVDGTGVPLLSYHAPAVDPRELGTRLESDANFGGPNTIAANGGTAAKLYTPPTFYFGSSLSHLDLTTFEGGENDLMTPVYNGGAARHPGAVPLAIFQDMGWLRADGAPNVVATGPSVGDVGQTITFAGSLVWPAYAGQPLTFTWTATDQMTVTHPGLAATDGVTFAWNTPGDKRLTLTATDGVVYASATRTFFARIAIFLPLVLRQ
ncbi:MAG: PKD domain-containing protein [Anaerolineae bacterium]|nr:PKD domain-containing protein [Anaerolineae bacterium]